MPPRTKRAPAKAAKKRAQQPLQDEVRSALTWLKRHSTRRTLDGMARYGIPSDNALGVTMADMKVLAKRLGRNHELAAALWDTGWYEARMLTSFVDEPARVTPTQMDRWCGDFDNWGISSKKSVNMALRAVGKRNPALNGAAVAVARRLADSPQTAARWVGKDALRELTSPAVTRRLAARRHATAGAMISEER